MQVNIINLGRLAVQMEKKVNFVLKEFFIIFCLALTWLLLSLLCWDAFPQGARKAGYQYHHQLEFKSMNNLPESGGQVGRV